MIGIQELLYDIDLKLNKIGTNEHQNIPIEDKIIALNDAQINVIKTKFSQNNIYKIGLDGFQKRYNDLEGLVVQESLTAKKVVDPIHSIYEIEFKDLKLGKYMLGIPGTEIAVCKKGACQSPVVIRIVKHGDVMTNINNTNTKPSFEYQETIGVISDKKILAYTDNTFNIIAISLNYIKYPIKVDVEGYIHFDGTNSINVDSELPYYLKEEIVDVAVRNLAMSSENQMAVQSSTIRLQNGE